MHLPYTFRQSQAWHPLECSVLPGHPSPWVSVALMIPSSLQSYTVHAIFCYSIFSYWQWDFFRSTTFYPANFSASHFTWRPQNSERQFEILSAPSTLCTFYPTKPPVLFLLYHDCWGCLRGGIWLFSAVQFLIHTDIYMVVEHRYMFSNSKEFPHPQVSRSKKKFFEIKNSAGKLHSRLDTTEKRIIELEDDTKKIT